MAKIQNLLCTCVMIVVISLVGGCGSPDLTSLRPMTSKLATLVLLVDHPSFLKADQLKLANSATTETFDISDVSSTALLQTVKRDLGDQDISSCMVIGDNLQPDMMKLAELSKMFAKVHFEAVSGLPISSIGMPNFKTIEPNVPAAMYAIGWLIGTFETSLSSQVAGTQPTIGFMPSELSVDDERAFFAGLYAIDPAADVVPVSLNGSVIAASAHASRKLGSIVLGANPKPGLRAAIRALKVPVFTLYDDHSSLRPAIQLGSFDTSEIKSLFQQFATGHWQAHDEQVIGMSSVSIDTHQMPTDVTSTWSSIEPIVFTQPDLWQTIFERLPQHTVRMLQSKFGIA